MIIEDLSRGETFFSEVKAGEVFTFGSITYLKTSERQAWDFGAAKIIEVHSALSVNVRRAKLVLL